MGLKLSKSSTGGSGGSIFRKTGESAHRGKAKVYGRQAQERVLEEEVPEVSEIQRPFKVFPGQAFPLGVSEIDNGINFAIFSQNATAVTLCLSLPQSGKAGRVDQELIELALDPHDNKTDRKSVV